MNTNLLFQSSPWFIPVCLLVGAAYAFVLYQKANAWSRTLNLALAAMRFVLVSLVCFLLLGLLLRLTRTSIEKKTVVLALDNSQSVGATGQRLLASLKTLEESLTDGGYAVEVQTLAEKSSSTPLDSVKFNARTTNLSDLLGRIRTNYEGRNLTDVVLLSDGIVNQGASPTYGTYPFAVQTLGIGDTIPKKDVNLKTVYANKIAYIDNQFPISADVLSYGFPGQSTRVQLKQGGAILDQKVVTFGPNETLVPLIFTTKAKAKGLQHYTIEAVPLNGEVTTRNNRREVYIEVIDGKEKILLAALSPHPDVKALRAILEKNQNFEVDVQVFNPVSPPVTTKKYDLIILHQLPDLYNAAQAWTRKLVDSGTPCLFVLGNQSGTAALNALNNVVQLSNSYGQTDKVTGNYNANFKLLNFDSQRLEILRKLPPLSVPYGDIRLQANAQAVLYQRVGTVETSKPLLIVGTGQKRNAVLLGEGLWQWRLEEFAQTEKQDVVDDLLLKIMQFVAAKDDKRKLRVYPLANEYQAGERVTFETEVYNDIYERLYDQTINLALTDEKGRARTYKYAITAGNSRFDVSDLPAGVYRYRATATVLGKPEEATGELVIKDEPLEALTTTADFNLLRQLSQQTGGKFFQASQVENLQANLLSHDAPDRITSTEELRELINLRWLFFIVLTLASAEWAIRKWAGGY